MVDAPSVESATDGSIVVCTADVGCGHGRAAAAIALELRERPPTRSVPVIDALRTAPRWFTSFYRDAYLFGVGRLPSLMASLYERTDVPGVPSHRGVASWMEASALSALSRSDAILRADLIVCTHFLCARVLSRMRGEGRLHARVVVVVTDQHPHAVWRVPNADLYCVASPSAKETMVRTGIDAARVMDLGIPIDARFARPLSPESARAKHHLPAKGPIVLVSGGGLGIGGLDRVLEGLLETPSEHFPVVVCGRNERLRAQLERRVAGMPDRCKIIGHTIHMHELMAAADLMVCKPGGLTTSEATAIGLPMVLLKPIPGQEEHNASMLVSSGAAVLEPDARRAGRLAGQLTRDVAKIERLRTASASLGRPHAASAIAKAVLDMAPARQATKRTDLARGDKRAAMQPA